jgi:hypothetical protein
VRWILRGARGLGTLAAAWWLFVGAAEAIAGREPWTLEGALLAILVVANGAGAALAWWREWIGGTVLIVAGAALCLFAYLTAGRNKGVAVLVSGAPFLLAGALILASRRRSRG